MRALTSRTLRPLQARRAIELAGLRVAPALTGGLIFWSHTSSLGHGAVAFASMLAAASLVDRSRFPLGLLPAARIALALMATVLGALLTFAVIAATGPAPAFGDVSSAVIGAWLVLALGAWFRVRVDEMAKVRVVVIGNRDFALDLSRELDESPVSGYELVGWLGQSGPPTDALEHLGTLRDVREVVVNRGIGLLVCAPGDDLSAADEHLVFEAIADFCIDLPVRMIGANQLYEHVLGHVPIGTIDGAWFRYIMHPRFRPTSPLSKRIFDAIGATLIAAFFAPALIAAAIAIKLGDGGPVIYRQRRVGENGSPFEILKLRTMRVDAEADGQARWSEANDDRVTRVGAILRRTHIDELPQLWNVLRGEMTLVGPRPERPELVGEIEQQFPHYSRRHLVKPGIAGWAQLRCGYAGSDLGTAWKLCHDLYYVKHSSLLGDTLILFETFLETFRDAHRALRSPSERFVLGEEIRG